jgi:plasmid stabilization system protein ParE
MIRVFRGPDVAAGIEDIWHQTRQCYGPAQADSLIEAIEEKSPFLAEYKLVGTNRPELGVNIRSFPL